MKTIEKIKYIIVAMIVIAVFSYVFYNSLYAFVCMCPLILFFLKKIKLRLKEKRKKRLKQEFKEMCQSLSAQLSAGYSLENAIYESYKELLNVFGENSDICREQKIIMAKLNINISIEDCFGDFAARSSIEDIQMFSDILFIAKRTGGDIINIVKMAADNIGQKNEVEREIESIVNEKKYEQSVMNIVPLFIIIYVRSTSGGMMNVMYDSIIGKIIMTICLLFYLFAYYLGSKILKIEV